jgi:hypothetical protein
VEAFKPPKLAVIVAVPNPTVVASPPAVMVAIEGLSTDHVADVVRYCCVPSLYVATAMNCCVLPNVLDRIVGLAGVTCNDVSVAVDDNVAPEIANATAGPLA